MNAVTKEPRLVFDKVSVEYQTQVGSLRVVDNVSLQIHQSEFVSIIGPSGCGKTTLMNLAAGFLTPTAGAIRLDGRKIDGPGRNRGVVFQEYGIFPWLTVEQNIVFGLRLRAGRMPTGERTTICERYMRLMGLSDFAKAYPKTLSGGMRQRLAIARAYAVRPELLLMDEPFGALDAQTRTNMQDLLLNVLQAEEKTVLLITHSVEEAIYLSSRVVVVSARPARIRAIVDIPFAYPRDATLHDRAEFSALRSELRTLVMREYAAQEQQARGSATE